MTNILIITIICFLWWAVPKVVNSKWWKLNISAPFPEVHPPICADCHDTNCKGCQYNNKGGL